MAITDAMVDNGLLDQATGFALTSTGLTWLTTELGIATADLRPSRRSLARACLDWTERRSHLAGAAGAHICRRLQENRWIKRIGGNKAVRLTPAGAQALSQLLGIDATRTID